MESNAPHIPALPDQGMLFDAAPGLASFEEAQANADRGMSQALSSARSIDPDWPEKAYEFLRRFAANKEYFVSEEVSALSLSLAMSQPKTLKSWGAIYARAARDNVISKVGTGISRNRHLSPCPLWKSLTYQGGKDGSNALLDSHLDPALPQAVNGFLRLSLRYDMGISADFLLMKIERFEELLDVTDTLAVGRQRRCVETQMHACKALPTRSDGEERVTYLREMADMLGKALVPGRTLVSLQPAIHAMVSSWNLIGVFTAIEDAATPDRSRRLAPAPAPVMELVPALEQSVALRALDTSEAELIVAALAHYAVCLDTPTEELSDLSATDRTDRTDRSLQLVDRLTREHGLDGPASPVP